MTNRTGGRDASVFIRFGLAIAAFAVVLPIPGLAQSSTADLQRALIGFKNHIQAGISYSEFPNAVASLNTEIELAERNKIVGPGASKALTVLKLDMTMMNMTWSLRFGPLADVSSPFTFCKSEVGKMFASTGAAFREQGLLDSDLKTEDLSGECAYYNDQTIPELLSAVARQSERTLDALTVPQKPSRTRLKAGGAPIASTTPAPSVAATPAPPAPLTCTHEQQVQARIARQNGYTSGPNCTNGP